MVAAVMQQDDADVARVPRRTPAAASRPPAGWPTVPGGNRAQSGGRSGGRSGGGSAHRRVRPQRPRLAVCEEPKAIGGYRMGRWSRLTMTILVAAAIVVGVLMPLGGAEPAASRWVTVGADETIATVVARTMPDVEPATAVAQVRELNDLQGWLLREGAVLRLP